MKVTAVSQCVARSLDQLLTSNNATTMIKAKLQRKRDVAVRTGFCCCCCCCKRRGADEEKRLRERW